MGRPVYLVLQDLSRPFRRLLVVNAVCGLAADRGVTPSSEVTVNEEDLQREREASAARRRDRLERLRRAAPTGDESRVRRLTSAEKRKLAEEEFVAPKE